MADQVQRSQTGTIFQRFRAFEDALRRWAVAQNMHIRGADTAQMADRLTQVLVALTSDSFTHSMLERGGVECVPVEQDTAARIINGIEFTNNVEQVKLPLRHIFMSIRDFLKLWARGLLAILRGLLAGKTARSELATLFMDSPIDSIEKIPAFDDFCREGPVLPLRLPRQLIVQAGFEARSRAGIIFTSWPLGYYIANLVERRILLQLLWRHLIAPLNFLLSVLQNRAACLLARDAALISVVEVLDRKKLIDAFIISLSHFNSQPLWLKGIKGQNSRLHMIWYSQNCVPKVYRDEKVESDLPSLKYIRADEHWVWTQGFADYLRGVGQVCDISIVGPILFYPPSTASALPPGRKIVLFDIVPIEAKAGVFGVAENYYSLSAIQKFVHDAVVATQELGREREERVWCLLKHKRRARSVNHSSQYSEFLVELEHKFPHFKVLDADSNLYGLLGECDASIAVPYTTTCAVASSLGKPSAYYDPLDVLVPRYESLPGVEFLSDADALKKFIGSATSRIGVGLNSGRSS